MRHSIHIAWACALAAAACAGARTQSPQAPGAIVGALRDSATGQPLKRGSACVWLTASPHAPPMRCVTADSVTGTFRIESLRPGRYTVRLQCASLTILGSILDTLGVEITDARPIRRDFSVATTTCDKRPRRVIGGKFRGYYSAGFEESRFVPCSADRWWVPGDSVGTRLVPRGEAWVMWRIPPDRRAPVAWPEVERDQHGVTRHYVRFSGTVTGPGHYGHFGIAPFLLAVDSVLEARAPGADDCG